MNFSSLGPFSCEPTLEFGGLTHMRRVSSSSVDLLLILRNDRRLTKNCSAPALYDIPNVLLKRQDWTKQCWDAGTNLPLVNINSGQSGENNCVELNAECG